MHFLVNESWVSLLLLSTSQPCFHDHVTFTVFCIFSLFYSVLLRSVLRYVGFVLCGVNSSGFLPPFLWPLFWVAYRVAACRTEQLFMYHSMVKGFRLDCNVRRPSAFCIWQPVRHMMYYSGLAIFDYSYRNNYVSCGLQGIPSSNRGDYLLVKLRPYIMTRGRRLVLRSGEPARVTPRGGAQPGLITVQYILPPVNMSRMKIVSETEYQLGSLGILHCMLLWVTVHYCCTPVYLTLFFLLRSGVERTSTSNARHYWCIRLHSWVVGIANCYLLRCMVSGRQQVLWACGIPKTRLQNASGPRKFVVFSSIHCLSYKCVGPSVCIMVASGSIKSRMLVVILFSKVKSFERTTQVPVLVSADSCPGSCLFTQSAGIARIGARFHQCYPNLI